MELSVKQHVTGDEATDKASPKVVIDSSPLFGRGECIFITLQSPGFFSETRRTSGSPGVLTFPLSR